MAQSSYLTNLLGIDPSGVEQTRYEYTLPIFNELLSKGLSEDQITSYDKDFGIFQQFPYKAKASPQQNYAQYEVVPQPEEEVVEEEEEEVQIDYSNTQDNKEDSNKFDTISTQKYGDIRDNTPETLDVSIPFNQMSEEEMMEYGKRKGYIGENGMLMGPQQFSDADMPPGLLSFGAKMMSAPIQALNDRQYNNYLKALKKKKMFLSGDDNKTFAEFSQAFKKANELSQSLNENLRIIGSEGQVKIPGTFKKVNAIFDQFAPSGSNNDVVYHTSSGGYYNNDGKFVTGYGQTVAFGSMDDAIDTLQAAASSGDSSIVPDKFDGDWVAKMNKAKTLTQNQKDEINNAWNQIQSNNYNNNNNNNDTFVSSGNNYYQGNKSYGDADDYTDNTSGV